MCSRIVSKSIYGDYIIEGNKRVWITEDGKRWTEVTPQYSGPIGVFTSNGEICPSGYKGGGLFS